MREKRQQASPCHHLHPYLHPGQELIEAKYLGQYQVYLWSANPMAQQLHDIYRLPYDAYSPDEAFAGRYFMRVVSPTGNGYSAGAASTGDRHGNKPYIIPTMNLDLAPRVPDTEGPNQGQIEGVDYQKDNVFYYKNKVEHKRKKEDYDAWDIAVIPFSATWFDSLKDKINDYDPDNYCRTLILTSYDKNIMYGWMATRRGIALAQQPAEGDFPLRLSQVSKYHRVDN